MSKYFLSSAIKFVPQMDISVNSTENGGIEASQGFVIRSADVTGLGSGNLALFVRGNRWEQVFPEIPAYWRTLTIKEVSDATDYAPGMMIIKVTFTGYAFAGTGGSSGEETTVPTTNLRGNLEEMPLIDCEAWQDLSDIAKKRLGMLLNGRVLYFLDTATWGEVDEIGAFNDFDSGAWPTPTGDELLFARMIAQGRTTFKSPSWNYNYRTESKTGFTAAQLNTLGKIVASPPGDPVKPATGWTWMLVGPDQSQSGPDRYVKDLSFQLIPDTPENQMLYGS